MTQPTEAAAKGEAGFTLVEVLVAFFIAALTLTMALRVLGEGAGWARRGPATALRMEEAVSVMDTLVADPALHVGERQGRFADGQPWHALVTDVTAEVVAKEAPARVMRVALYAARAGDAPTLTTLTAVARLQR